MTVASVLAMSVIAFAVSAFGAQPDEKEAARIVSVGPRGAIGPDVPLSESEKRQFANRVTVEGHTAAAVQAACARAAKEGTRVVFLPAGQYVFDTQVDVPGGLMLLGEGANTLCQNEGRNTRLFGVDGDLVRFTRLKLVGADTSSNADNDTCGISVSGKKNVRVDHCELFGFRYALNFVDEASAQVDHCLIHDNLRAGQGYGVLVTTRSRSRDAWPMTSKSKTTCF